MGVLDFGTATDVLACLELPLLEELKTDIGREDFLCPGGVGGMVSLLLLLLWRSAAHRTYSGSGEYPEMH